MLGSLIKKFRNRNNKLSPPPRGEIATIADGRDITRGFTYGLLEPQDRILWLEGGSDYQIYEDILRDDRVFSTCQQRRLAIVCREWETEAGGTRALDKKAADFIKEVCDHIKFDNLTEKMWYARYYGWKCAEANWARDGRNVYPDTIKVKSNRRFKFWEDGSLRLLTTQNPLGEILPDRKFWILSCGGDHDDEPYGLGLAHYLYWLIFFKRNDLSFWSIFLEKFGQPTALGRYPNGATDTEQGKLLQALAAIQTDSGIILPEGMIIELIEASRSGTADYSAFYEVLNKSISQVVLGQTMTTDDGSSKSQAEVHSGVKKEIVKADADLICQSFNEQIVRWLVDWNFPGAAYPRVWRNLEDSEDLNKRVERENIIVSWGFKPKIQYVIETYGGEWEKKEENSGTNPKEEKSDKEKQEEKGEEKNIAIKVIQTQDLNFEEDSFDFAQKGKRKKKKCVESPASRKEQDFAEIDNFPLPETYSKQLRERTEPIILDWIDSIKEMLGNSTDLQEFSEKLTETYPDFDTGEITDLIASAMAASRLGGMDNAND